MWMCTPQQPHDGVTAAESWQQQQQQQHHRVAGVANSRCGAASTPLKQQQLGRHAWQTFRRPRIRGTARGSCPYPCTHARMHTGARPALEGSGKRVIETEGS
jgi:hypothetical protein